MTKGRSKEAETTRMAKVIETVLDAVIQIILLENVRNHQRTRTKELTSEVLGVIAICLRIDLEPDEWIKDSGCSKHMTGYRKLFSTYKAYNGGNVVFGSNLLGNIIGKGKQTHASHKAKNIVSMTRFLELLHMDLFSPSTIRSYGENLYTLVIVDDYSSPQSNGVEERKNRTLQ
ncbi:retrovirus-related pol polyprotein from transposon TNT 1-94 [Tanacetum coccineum]